MEIVQPVRTIKLTEANLTDALEYWLMKRHSQNVKIVKIYSSTSKHWFTDGICSMDLRLVVEDE